MAKLFRKTLTHQREPATSPIVRFFQEKMFHVNIILGIAVLLAGMAYLLSMNHSSTKGFEIKGLETRLQTLEEQNQRLELKVTELQSLSMIQEASKTMNMVAASSIEFAPAVGSVFAIR